MRKSKLYFVALAATLIQPCCAALGESVASVETDRVRMNASIRHTAAARYTVHHLESPPALTVREYVSPGGIVFAVGWNGMVKPDLRQLLGSHFEAFVAETARGPHAGRAVVYVTRPEVVIESTGHMRSFVGRAFVPAEVPDGVSPADIH